MKKISIVFILIIIIIFVVWFRYLDYKTQYTNIQKLNLQFEKYYGKEIYGTDLATAINKAVDENTRNKVKKDEKNQFISNDENSINIDIKMTDIDQIYRMESFYKGEIEKFVQHYGTIKFQCSKIEYHDKTNKIKYLFFEQIQ